MFRLTQHLVEVLLCLDGLLGRLLMYALGKVLEGFGYLVIDAFVLAQIISFQVLLYFFFTHTFLEIACSVEILRNVVVFL